MIPDKDEKVYFNVDLTEPDEVYELTGYQESKIKVKFLKFLTRGSLNFGLRLGPNRTATYLPDKNSIGYNS